MRVAIVLLLLVLTGCLPVQTGAQLKSPKPERSFEPKSPKFQPSPTPAPGSDLVVELPITDPLCGSMRVLHAVGEWAFITPPAEIVAALDLLEQIDAAVAVAIGQVDDAQLRTQLELAEQDLAHAIVLFRSDQIADGLETITAIRVDVALANFMATTAGTHCGIT